MKKLLIMLMLAVFSFSSVVHAQTTPAATHTKKDGTPDKRYKDNKAAKPAGPLKKDGTPDMRYKSNNPNAGKKKTTH